MNDIFLIDDDSFFNYLNKEVIKEVFPQKIVQAFDNAAEAIEVLENLAASSEQSFPKIILLDINMPIMDGWEFLDLFNKLPSHIIEKCKVIMHTSSIDPRDIEKAKTYPIVSDFISKPLTPQIVAQVFNF